MWQFARENPFLFTFGVVALSYYMAWAIRGAFIRKPDNDGE